MYCYAGELHVWAANTRSSDWQRSTIDCERIDPHRILIARLSDTGVATDKHGIFASSNDDCFWPIGDPLRPPQSGSGCWGTADDEVAGYDEDAQRRRVPDRCRMPPSGLDPVLGRRGHDLLVSAFQPTTWLRENAAPRS